MENIVIDEEPILSYYSSTSNFGVCSKDIKSEKIIKMSFSPLSSNHKISFSNTIMIPLVATEASLNKGKNISNNYKKEKSKTPINKDNEKHKLELTDKDKSKFFDKKQMTKIFEGNNKIKKINENKKVKVSSEKKPFFNGDNILIDANGLQNNNLDIDKKVNKLLKKNTKHIQIEDINLFLLESSKNPRKGSGNENNKNNKLNNSLKRMNTLGVTLKRREINKEGKEPRKKTRKEKFKCKMSCDINNNIIHYYKSNKNIKKINSCKKSREIFDIYNPPIEKMDIKSNIKSNKMNNIKIFRESLFNHNNSSKLKLKQNIIKDKIEKKEQKKKINKRQTHKALKIGLHIKFQEKQKESEKIDINSIEKKETKDLQIKDIENNYYYLGTGQKKAGTNIISSKLRKGSDSIKEIIKNDKKKTNSLYSKRTLLHPKKLDFESAFKNKKNMAKTQFNLFSPDKFTNTEFCDSDYCEYTLDCMNLILNKNKVKKQQKNKINFNFPKSKGNKIQKKIALFDLDETLVHCTGEINSENGPYQHCINIILPGGKETKVGINIRPLWKKTLNLIRKYYHIVVFTASHQAYADAVLNYMDPNNRYFKYRLYRNNCSLVEVDESKFYVKDLDIFDEYYDLKDIIIIDNSVLSFFYHLENGIPIVPYYNEDKDGSLYVVGLYLVHIFNENDLREANKKYINLNSFLNEAKSRQDKDIISLNEESTKVENTDGINNEKEKEKGENIYKENILSKDKKEDIVNNFDEIRNKKRYSFIQNNSRKLLMSRSRLIHIYYELNEKPKSDKMINNIMEEKMDKSFSVDEEEEMNKMDFDENINASIFRRKLSIDLAKPFIIGYNSKSNKTLYNDFNLEKLCSKFFKL